MHWTDRLASAASVASACRYPQVEFEYKYEFGNIR